MRLFIAINFDEEIKNYLMNLIEEFKQSAEKGNFTLRNNLHLTMVFIGEVSTDQLGLIKSAMNRIKEEPFSITIGGLGKFKRRGGDIYWVDVEKNQSLGSINSLLSSELRKAGFQIEDREFTPHLTLGREVILKTHQDMEKYKQLAQNREMQVTKVSLMKSERISGKLTYTEIYAKDL
ncbi:RNA 2',3'-cyclic phosphodiesterase [Sinanaerobacter chloroacetimidivorans]|uniref:RNA 2',3'-cyclic phosphodiesterase n=1 Tax=Sinanaerobacter chloroacetimidivorans TaxID=2818044 RepID=A0A8J7W6T4_9FIRM|nr:RNA 2',3'-cyclic phosphodiesterase [Sinanaerobacter chloroacetimidivorans]MBR0599990.1 RNA 2',3'-cyclic phosphodiesterase [Sinanaerobacter chloroacetimidivorans]